MRLPGTGRPSQARVPFSVVVAATAGGGRVWMDEGLSQAVEWQWQLAMPRGESIE
jgi:hypothetical protein